MMKFVMNCGISVSYTHLLAKGYDAVCAFVNSDVGTKTVEALHEAGVKLILMRCAGFNNVDLKTAAKYGIDVRRVPGYSPEAVAEHAMTLAMTVNRHMQCFYGVCSDIGVYEGAHRCV